MRFSVNIANRGNFAHHGTNFDDRHLHPCQEASKDYNADSSAILKNVQLTTHDTCNGG
jgi:hypothetical protein